MFKEMLELLNASKMVCFLLGVIVKYSFSQFSLILIIKFIFGLFTSKFKATLLEHYHLATIIC